MTDDEVAEVRQIWSALDLPGVTHFMPKSMMDKVWNYFLDICQASIDVRLDTTMDFTPFVDETMPFPPVELRRLQRMGDRILFGSDFPNIPHGYADAMRAITEIPGIDDAWLRAVFYGNAATLFAVTGDATES